MKRYFYIILCLLCCTQGFSQKKNQQKAAEPEGFVFTTVKEVPITSVKDQNSSSTCWSFSGLGFFEAELLRTNKGEFDLAEMFVVHHTMVDRAENYVRLHGNTSFAPGGSFYDVVYCWQNYGIVPQEAMPGIMYGEKLPVHGELDAVAEAYAGTIAKGRFSKLTPVWKDGLSAIYDTYLGKYPETFSYKGKTYTPKSFAAELGLNMDNYVSLTSYTHHPFYTTFSLEIEDNWRNGLSYNIPIDELIDVMDNSIEKGYSVLWGSDVSENGFDRQGVGVVVNTENGATLTGTDMEHWLGLSKTEQVRELTSRPYPEMEITQEMRQIGFDNWETTDDHGMLIFGIANDQTGKPYYMVKNSWGTDTKYNGIWYVTKAFAKYKTMNILVHKDAIPQSIKNKLGIK